MLCGNRYDNTTSKSALKLRKTGFEGSCFFVIRLVKNNTIKVGARH